MKREELKTLVKDELSKLSFDDTVLVLTAATNGSYMGSKLHSYELVDYIIDCYEAIAEDEDSFRQTFRREMKDILDELHEDYELEGVEGLL